jgi:hypothetical protein
MKGRENARPRVIRGTQAELLPLLPSGPGGVYNRPLHEARSLTTFYAITDVDWGYRGYALRTSFRGFRDAQFSRTLGAWKYNSRSERQAQLAKIAREAGTLPERLVTNVVTRFLDERARFLAGVEKGIAAADRGET